MMTKFTSLLTILLLSLILNSCGGNEGLSGKWTLTNIDYSEHLKNIQPELKESFIGMMDRQGAKILNKTFFEFEEDEVFKITAPKFNGKSGTLEGRWAMNDAKDSLVIENEGFETYAVMFKDDNTVLLSSGEQPFRILTLVRK